MENILPLSPELGQGKLTTRCKNKNIRHENDFLKANEWLHKVWELKIYRMVPKTYVQISWDYPFNVYDSYSSNEFFYRFIYS
jgi:hypothetical protein